MRTRPIMILTPAALAFAASQAIAQADSAGWNYHQYTLCARTVATVNGWDYESNAQGCVSGGCSAGGDACRNRPASPNCSSEGRSGFANNWLDATSWSGFGAAADEEVTAVRVNAYGSWTNSVAGAWQMRAAGSISQQTWSGTKSGGCGWLTSGGGRLLSAPTGGWTQDKVNRLTVGVKRDSSTTPSETFFISGFEATVTTRACGAVYVVSDPLDQATCAGRPVSFSALGQGDGTVLYQWYRDGQPILGATGSSYTLPAAQLTDDLASFSCRVFNQCGSWEDTGEALLEVYPALQVTTTPPASQSVCADELEFGKDLCVDADGPEATFTWRRNGQIVAQGPFESCYTADLTDLASGAASFTCHIDSLCGSRDLGPFTLTRTDAPEITSQSSGEYRVAPGATLQLRVGATGTSPQYQWSLDGLAIADGASFTGTRTANLTIRSVNRATEGEYSCLVYNGCGEDDTFDPVAVISDCAPVITRQPQEPGAIPPCASIVLSLAASGSGPLSYQWYQDGEPLNDNELMHGSHTPTLVIAYPTSDASGFYECEVGGNCSDTSAYSDLVYVDIECFGDWDYSGGIDGQDIEAFFYDFEDGDADVNLDGSTDGGDMEAFFRHWECGC
ncbi:MAG: immunoglobulin domain-containing protein [Planctomycetes bacterium]|nr:immunoglobulin domain-containing protein [Planctomycetota bacterium]